MDSESEFFTDDDGLDDFAATPHPAPALGMVMAALGVVYGDIGTSPLYAMQTVFNVDHGVVPATSSGVYGVVSLIFWSITAVVSIKYIVLVLRADNDGEGGVLALAALARRALSGGQAKRVALVTTLGLLGAALYWGDSVVTPAISVMSAVEGLGVANPSLRPAVLPIAVGVVVALFAVQRWGTARIGRLFGPSMLIWFLFLGVTGLAEVVRHPTILAGLSPHYAWLFVVSHPGAAFAALTGVVLVVTGAEALYADLGHFGAHAIRRAWFGIAFPALTLNYLAQGALILHNPAARRAPFYLLVPAAARLPATILATAATVIASQAVITGAFSLTRQAVRLGLLPYLAIHHTSEHERGQVFLPAINKGLLVAVLAVMIGFRSSGHLAAAYGLSVSGTFLTTSLDPSR